MSPYNSSCARNFSSLPCHSLCAAQWARLQCSLANLAAPPRSAQGAFQVCRMELKRRCATKRFSSLGAGDSQQKIQFTYKDAFDSARAFYQKDAYDDGYLKACRECVKSRDAFCTVALKVLQHRREVATKIARKRVR